MHFAYLIEPPFNDRDAAGRVTGCDVELAQHVATALGADFVPEEASFAELLPGLASGRWRMTTGLFATPERQQVADFSRPIWALPDGLLVAAGNPLGLTGYRSLVTGSGTLAVIRDQVQHRSALSCGVPPDRILICTTYAEAATAVRDGRAVAYASVARAHAAHVAQHPGLAVVPVPVTEKPAAYGAFGFAKGDTVFRDRVNAVLAAHIGSPAHRSMMQRYGFAAEEIDLLL